MLYLTYPQPYGSELSVDVKRELWESGDRRNVFSYRLKRLVLLIMTGDFQNGGNFPSVPTFPSPRFPRFLEENSSYNQAVIRAFPKRYYND